jgi:hypothetical protein
MLLYEVPLELNTLYMRYERLLDSTIGEITPEVEALEAEISTYLAASADKVEAAAMVLRNLEADRVAADSEAKRLANRAKSIEHNIDRLKALMLMAVKKIGKIKTPRFTIYLQKSKDTVSYSMSPDIMPDVFAAMYPDFSRVIIELNKTAVQEFAKAGNVVPPEIIATEKEGTEFLRIS